MRFLIKVMPLGGEHGHITLLYNWISFVNNFTLRYISTYFFLELTPHVELTPRVADGSFKSPRRSVEGKSKEESHSA